MKAVTAIVETESRALAKPLVIARGAIAEVEFVTVQLTAEGATGRGESCPVPYFGESVAGVVAQAADFCERLRQGADWLAIHDSLPAGAARNAVDCAWWDWRAKSERRRVWQLLDLPRPAPVTTAYTIGIDRPEAMGDAARAAAARYPLLKVKLGGVAPDDLVDLDRIRAVRAAAPQATLIADANEGWTLDQLRAALPVLAEAGFAMLEQPLKAGEDALLQGLDRRIPIAADESCHVAADVDRLTGLYDMVNIKLDKTGGLTEALCLLDRAEAAGMQAMVGCMLGTSLAMAPGLLLAGRCTYADLDAPLLMGSDRAHGLTFDGALIQPASAALWG